MENNLVELKFDNVYRFFDELKIKYENEYQDNKTITKEIYVHPIIRILSSNFYLFRGILVYKKLY